MKTTPSMTVQVIGIPREYAAVYTFNLDENPIVTMITAARIMLLIYSMRDTSLESLRTFT